jgi:hypothetical protein
MHILFTISSVVSYQWFILYPFPFSDLNGDISNVYQGKVIVSDLQEQVHRIPDFIIMLCFIVSVIKQTHIREKNKYN